MAGRVPFGVVLLIDMSAARSFIKEYDKVAPKMLRDMGERHVKQLVNRWVALSAGQGGWAKLSQATIDSKAAKGAPNPSYILREYDDLMHSMDFVIKRDNSGYDVGFVRTYPHPRSEKTVAQLAIIHQQGRSRAGSHLPKRSVVAYPSAKNKRALFEIARKYFDQATEKANASTVIKTRKK